MTNDATTLAAAIAILRPAYPRQEFPDDSVRIYVRALRDMEPRLVKAAIERIILKSKWLPTVAEIREEAAEMTARLPSAAEAWTIMKDRPYEDWPDALRATVRACGGRWHIVHSERPETVRAQFIADYNERRRAVVGGVTLKGIARPVQELTYPFGGSRAEIEYPPHTESMPPRPVWARWLRRQECTIDRPDGVGTVYTPLPPPTDAEKHDAILVLRDFVPLTDGMRYRVGDDPLAEEAQRILDEATP